MPAASPSVRRPEARRAVAHFVQAALRELSADVAGGTEVPFALDTRGRHGGPALYEYRPLYRAYVEARLERLVRLPDYTAAVRSLADDPAVLGVAHDHAPEAESDESALRGAVLVPLVVGVAEGAGAFDFDDRVFDGIFDRMLSDVAQTRRSFTGFAPVLGLRAADGVHDLGQDIHARRISPAELAEAWPECQGLLPERFGLARDRLLALELDVALPRVADAELPDTARRFARAILALRIVFGGPITAGPVLFERVDWAPRAVRALPASVTQTLPGEPVRLDPQRLYLVRALADRMADAEMHGGPVAVALGRWAAASGAAVSVERAAGLAASVEPLLGADGAGHHAVAMRAAALVGANASDREDIAIAMRSALGLSRPDAPLTDTEALAVTVGDVARSVLAAALDHGADASQLGGTLDAVLLGSRPRPQSVTNLVRSA
jgi:hypothetical protein